MNKIYRYHQLYIIFLGLFFLIILTFFGIDYKETFKRPLYILGFIAGVQGLLFSIPQLFLRKIKVNDKKILEIQRPQSIFFRETKRELNWDEIGYIVDDYVSPILFYPPYKLHIFHIMPKDYIIKPFKRISISWWIKDYQELLKEVIENVGSDVVIEDYIFEFLKRYEEKKLKRKKKQ